MKVQEAGCVIEGSVLGRFSQKADIKQLEEAKRTLEVELEEIKSQLESDGYTSVADMRCEFQYFLRQIHILLNLTGTAGICHKFKVFVVCRFISISHQECPARAAAGQSGFERKSGQIWSTGAKEEYREGSEPR